MIVVGLDHSGGTRTRQAPPRRGRLHAHDRAEGITEQVREWRTDVVARIVAELGLEQVTFEAADPDVFSRYIKNYGIDVNLSSTTAKSSSSSACEPASGARTTPGAGCSPTAGEGLAVRSWNKYCTIRLSFRARRR